MDKLSKLEPGKVNSLAKGNNALHILIKHGNSDSDEFIKCADILINAGIDVNQGDEKGISPILWAAKKEYKGLIKLLLDNTLLNVDLDTHQSRGKTARSIIQEKGLYSGTLPASFNNSYDYGRVLFAYLKSDNETAFVNFKNGDIISMSNIDDSSSTLLQISCDKGLREATSHLLNKGNLPPCVF